MREVVGKRKKRGGFFDEVEIHEENVNLKRIRYIYMDRVTSKNHRNSLHVCNRMN